MLHEEAVAAGEQVSLATVYNTLHQFQARRPCCASSPSGVASAYFDTNTSNHNHFFIEKNGELVDIPGDAVRVDGIPAPPGMRISHIDIVVRLVGSANSSVEAQLSHDLARVGPQSFCCSM